MAAPIHHFAAANLHNKAHTIEAEVVIPEGEVQHVVPWTAQSCWSEQMDQYAEEFAIDATLATGDIVHAGGRDWSAVAAPGHDMDAVMFFADDGRILVSGDALWQKGMGFVWPESAGESRTGFLDHAPRAVVEGRPFLYDARISSGNGEASCASCHVFGDMDHLGWDLGNPDDLLTSNPMVIRFLPANVPPGLNGVGVVDVFHPMKGPMTTQTLRGMQNGGAMHWRGDRSNGFYGASPDDENLAFRNFIVAFQGLLGSEAPISDADMQRFADFALSLVLPPNPVRRLDDQLTANAAQGRTFFFNTPTDGQLTCENCHRLDASQGFFGGGTFSTFEGSSQIFKVPHLRNAYAKVGMFGFLAPGGGGAVNTGDQVRGFGYSHDGSIDTLFRFVSGAAFVFPSDVERRNMEAFMLQFDQDLAPIVGQQATLTSTNAAVVGPRIDLLIARASAPFQSLLLGGATTECELVVKGAIGGRPRGWLRLPNGLFQRDDDPIHGRCARIADPLGEGLMLVAS